MAVSSQINESVLLKTSAATDVKNSNGMLTIAGLPTSTRKSRITNFEQVKYRAEVVQVYTVTTTYTPAALTTYALEIGDTNRIRNGAQEVLTQYSYVTPSVITTLGATAALQREAIAVALIGKINATTTSNFIVAATSTGGAGFTITDSAGYYPVFQQGVGPRLGASTVYAMTNTDGSGLLQSMFAISTAAIYESGVGVNLALWQPRVDQMYGNLIQGYLGGVAPLTVSSTAALNGLPAVSGQNYDVFVINSLALAPAMGGAINSQFAYKQKSQCVFVDNGTGTATTNLTGFKAFERAIHENIVSSLFVQDVNAVVEFFDKPILFQDPLGAAPTGTADTLGSMLSPYGSLNKTNIGTQTIVSPVLDATGLLIDQDDTATEGIHVSANQQTLGVQQFVVGQDEFSVVARVVAADWTDTAFMVGFRRKAVYGAVINNYTDYATIGSGSSAAGTTWINGDLIVTRATINSGATLQTISAVAPLDAVSIQFIVKVALDGTVRAYADGVSYPIYSAGTTQMVFDAGDIMIPFFQFVNISDAGAPGCSISEFVAVAKKDWIQTAIQ